MKKSFLALCLCAAPTFAIADEVWTSTQMGTITYASDHGSVAMFTAPGSHPGSTIHFYLEGLGGNYTNSGTFTGYWIESAPGSCNTNRTGPDGTDSDAWGKFEIEFDTVANNRSFTGRLGTCDGAFTEEFYAQP